MAQDWGGSATALGKEPLRHWSGATQRLALLGKRAGQLPGVQRARAGRSPLVANHRGDSAGRPKSKRATGEKLFQTAVGPVSEGQSGVSDCGMADRSSPAAQPPQSTTS
jgi:hypothetical protein